MQTWTSSNTLEDWATYTVIRNTNGYPAVTCLMLGVEVSWDPKIRFAASTRRPISGALYRRTKCLAVMSGNCVLRHKGSAPTGIYRCLREWVGVGVGQGMLATLLFFSG